MVPSIARQSVILKCNMQKSVMLGNRTMLRKMIRLAILKNLI